MWHEPTDARPNCHKVVGLVPTGVRHLHQLLQLVQVEVSLQAGDNIVELVPLDYQTRLDRHIMVYLFKQTVLENIRELHLLRICVHLAG